jgi:hypothetical protein
VIPHVGDPNPLRPPSKWLNPRDAIAQHESAKTQDYPFTLAADRGLIFASTNHFSGLEEEEKHTWAWRPTGGGRGFSKQRAR